MPKIAAAGTASVAELPVQRASQADGVAAVLPWVRDTENRVWHQPGPVLTLG